MQMIHLIFFIHYNSLDEGQLEWILINLIQFIYDCR